MQTTTFETSTTQLGNSNKYVHAYVFVVQLIDGRFVIGSADNTAKRIARLNSGYVKGIPDKHQIHRIVGIKEQNPERNLIQTAKYFIDKYGQEKVVVI